MSELEILVPVPPTRTPVLAPAPRLAALAGRRIGWLDNRKANAGALLDGVAGALAAAGHEFTRECADKNATAAAPETVMAHLRTCDAVVLAIAD
ncbi:MAG: hypothetical protein RLW61_09770 [Gammaproteobacteria bacterium]